MPVSATREISTLVIAAGLLGCSDPPGEVPRAADAQRDELRALGYAAWDDTGASRAGGVTVLDSTRVSPWPRVWADDRSTIHVIGIDGQQIRAIQVPGRSRVEFARVLEGGRIACVSVDEGLTLLEADGSVVWQLDVAAHHEVTVVPDGSEAGHRRFALATHGEREYRGRRVRFDRVEFVDEATGMIRRSAADDPGEAGSSWSAAWDSFDARRALMARAEKPHTLDADAPPVEAEARPIYDYFHLNGIAFDGPGRMVLCLRNVDLIVALDTPGDLAWSLGPATLDWPHAPSIVGASRARHAPGAGGDATSVLVFDNGKHRGWSRVVELDPDTGQPTWEWRGTAADPIFSDVRGFVQRLPNGNTLVTESERGRVLEITHDREVVWEYWNPEVSGSAGNRRRRIYRMMAVPPTWITVR